MAKYDELGLPRDHGSTDNLDSARMAGACVIFGLNKEIDLSVYVIPGGYTRHPLADPSKMLFSRDQASVLFAGLYFQGKSHLVEANYQPPNGDIIMPSVRGHFKRCAGLKASWFQDLWLWLDVLWSCFIDPLAESNQLICMLKVHPSKAYLKFWCKWNKKWRNSILNYWSENEGAWRGEPELADLMIKTIEEDVK